MARELTLVSWNIHGCYGSDRRFDLSRVARVLEDIGAQVVALQEVGEVRGRMPLLDQARALAERTGMNFAFMAAVSSGRRRYGNAILTKFPIVFERHYDLSVGRREPRGCLRTDLDLGGGDQLHLFNLHLGLGVRERRRQAMLLTADILHDAALAFPMVVVGDFNAPRPGHMRALLRRALFDAALELQRADPTYPARLPFMRLDRILAGEGVVPREIQVIDRGEARIASDHLPLWSRLEILPPRPEALASETASAPAPA